MQVSSRQMDVAVFIGEKVKRANTTMPKNRIKLLILLSCSWKENSVLSVLNLT